MGAVLSFLAMGGYASFVWPAYGVAAAVLAWMVIDSIAAYRRAGRELLLVERELKRR